MQRHALALLVCLLLPSKVLAEPEVLLTLGGVPTRHVGAPPGEPAPDTVTFAVHEGDVRHVPACNGIVGTSLSPEGDRPRMTVVRFLKRPLPDGTCEVEVLMVRPQQQPTGATSDVEPSESTDTLPLSAGGGRGGLSKIDPMSLPCGTEIVEIRNAGTHGSIGGVRGIGPTGECADERVHPADAEPQVPEDAPAAWRNNVLRITHPDGTTTTHDAVVGLVVQLDRDAAGGCTVNDSITGGMTVALDTQACTLTVDKIDTADTSRVRQRGHRSGPLDRGTPLAEEMGRRP